MKLQRALLDPFVGGEIEVEGPGYVFRGIIASCQDVGDEVVVGVECMVLSRDGSEEWVACQYVSHSLKLDQQLMHQGEGFLRFVRIEVHETVTLRRSDAAFMDPARIRQLQPA